MSLYFGNAVSIKTTILLAIFLGLLTVIVIKRKEIHHWGWLTLGIFSFGLYICTIGATRDELHLTIQHAIDGSGQPGIFSLVCLQTIVGSVLGIVIVVSAILCVFLRKQIIRKRFFFVITGSMLIKILTIELSRIILFVS